MADQGPLSGTMLGGRYLLYERLGSGGFADVYRAEHRHLKTIHAVKVLTRQLSAAEIAQFRAEAQTIAALAHPHILRVSDFDLDNGIPFLVMDYAPGGTLRQQYPSGSRVPLASVVEYVKQVAEALQHAHDQRRIHRDIKPQNLLLGRQGEVLLSDFGIAVIAQSTSQRRTLGYSGTAAYSAPEQILGKPRPASDQYALGVVIYEWLVGRLPFQGGMVEMIGQHLNAPVPSLRASAPDLVPAVEQVVLKALAKDPKDRFASVQEFAAALEKAYQISLRPPLGTLLLTYTGHTKPVQGVTWAPDSKLLVSASLDGTMQIWDAISGQHHNMYTYPDASENLPHQKIAAIAWAPDGEKLAVVIGGWRLPHYRYSGFVHVWDVRNTQNGHLLFPALHGSYLYASWSPDSRFLALTGQDSVHILEIETGDKIEIVSPFYPDKYLDHWWRSPVWRPDGHHIAVLLTYTRGPQHTRMLGDKAEEFEASMRSMTGNVHVFEYTVEVKPAGREICTYSDATGPVSGGIWSPDGSRLASNRFDQTIQIWDSNTAQHFCTYSGHSEKVRAIAWSPDGKRIASSAGGHVGPRDFTIHIWDTITGQHLYTSTSHAAPVNAVAWSPDGSRIASGSDDGTVQVWSAG
jgi:serine/threonine protein kinase